MQKHRDVLQQASRLAVAVALCIAAMLAVYALTGHFTNAVLLGALIGFVMAMGNFLSLSILPLLFAQFCIKLIDFFRPDPQAAQKTKDGDSTP